MGYQLWVSPHTGERRNGTGFIDFKKIFTDSVTAKTIYEKLHCCNINDNALHLREELEKRDFDSAGVIDENKRVIGYVLTKDLRDEPIHNFLKEINTVPIISDSSPLSEMINVFERSEFVYVNFIDQVVGIISKADLNKPPVRVYLFGVISLFELHLSFWINHFFRDDDWRKYISVNRIADANTIFMKRKEKGLNQNINLIECLQLCDKKKILCNSDDFLGLIDLSKNQLKDLIEHAESVRNDLAHSQSSIIDTIDFNNMSKMIIICERFLIKSDELVMDIIVKD